jgi:hypothetical protein
VSLVASRFDRTNFHCATREGALTHGATGAIFDTDAERAVAELYDPSRVNLNGKGM